MRPSDRDFRLDVGGSGWDCFKKALLVRHRITHLKSAEVLEISDDEVQVVVAA
jgi:hypothetical protein